MDRLRLAALDAEDLQVVSAHVQDAVMIVGDIRYMPREQKAVFVMNRFVWDKARDKRSRQHERRRTALSVSRVLDMKVSGIRQDTRDTVLELLAVTFEETDAPAGRIRLTFAGGAALVLTVECIEVQMADLGAAWSTPNLPSHELD
ncbi:DUF2948 family protein [Roseibium litorale]|uniref:DUF2948 family protein n=1 Tax=Roseibium litorale TaxID=2803841 RepID=A0ABR9CTX9_9HYPH|nr:DUF2948 family protein [Roseibium litorale]MBD8894336.1 DUF2948 family protein [Roseibium litorale]